MGPETPPEPPPPPGEAKMSRFRAALRRSTQSAATSIRKVTTGFKRACLTRLARQKGQDPYAVAQVANTTALDALSLPRPVSAPPTFQYGSVRPAAVVDFAEKILRRPPCVVCKEQDAVVLHLDEPISYLPAGCDGFHVIGLGPKGAWKPLRPEAADGLEWDRVQKVSAEDRENVFCREPDDPSYKPEEGLFYPHVPKDLDLYLSNQYRAGLFYKFDFSPERRALHAVCALNSAVHPKFMCPPDPVTGYPEQLRVPGQLQMTPGVPVAVYSSQKKHKGYMETVATLHTPSTLLRLPHVSDDFQSKLVELCTVLFGNPDGEGLERKPIYELGLKHNARDHGSHASPFEGSYSMGFTAGEGEGVGNIQPAQQSGEAHARLRQSQLCNIVGYISPQVLEGSIRKREFDGLRFRGVHNNAPCFGHESNDFFNALQMNVTFARAKGMSLIDSLGRHQGCTHVDPHDCICGYTVFTLVCTLPKGSDPGPFCFPENGLYAHTVEQLEGVQTEYGDVYIAFLVFKGRKLHGGYAPRAFWDEASTPGDSDVLGVRIGLVAYPNGPALDRTGTVAVGPPNGFSGSMLSATRKQHQRNMLQAGLVPFSSRKNAVKWLSREFEYATENDLAMMTALLPWVENVPFGLRDRIEQYTFFDEEGVLCHASAEGIIDPILEHEEYTHQCRLFAHQHECSVYFNLNVTKANVKDARAAADRQNMIKPPPFLAPAPDQTFNERVAHIIGTRDMVNDVVYAVELADKPGHVVWVRDSAWNAVEEKEDCLEIYHLVTLWKLYPDMYKIAVAEIEDSAVHPIVHDVDLTIPLDDGGDMDVIAGSETAITDDPRVLRSRKDKVISPAPSSQNAADRSKKDSAIKAAKKKQGKVKSASAKKAAKKAKPDASADQDEDEPDEEPYEGRDEGEGEVDELDGDANIDEDFAAPMTTEREEITDVQTASTSTGKRRHGESLDEQLPLAKRQKVLNPEMRLGDALLTEDWDTLTAQISEGRRALYSLTPASERIRDLVTLISKNERASARYTTISAQHRTVYSLHLAIDCAKEYPKLEAVKHLADLLKLYSNVGICRTFVNLKRWLLYDGPALADFIFAPVILGGKPTYLDIPWIDSIARGVYSAISDYAKARDAAEPTDGGTAPAKAKRRKQALQQEIEILDVLPDPDLEPMHLRRSRRKVVRPAPDHDEVLGPVEIEDEFAIALAMADDDDGDDGDDSDDSDYVLSDDEDELDDGVRDGLLDGPVGADRASATAPGTPLATSIRRTFEAFIPAVAANGKPSISASSRKRKYNLTFSTFSGGSGLRLYDTLVRAFVEALFDLVMARGLRKVMDDFNIGYKSRSDSLSTLITHVIARGWMLETLATAAGTEAVWASEKLQALWCNAHLLSSMSTIAHITDPLRTAYYTALREKKAVQVTPALQDTVLAIHRFFTRESAMKASINTFGRHFLFHVDEVAQGRLEPDTADLPSQFAPPPTRSPAPGAPQVDRPRTKRATPKKGLPVRPGAKPEDLTSLPDESTLKPVSHMLSLAYERHKRKLETADAPALASGDKAAECFYTGRNPRSDIGASTRFTSDQMNPVIAFWNVTDMFRDFFTSDNIRQAPYFMGLVLAIATGQSMVTEKFFQEWKQEDPQDRAAMLKLYDDRKHQNDLAVAGKLPKKGIYTPSYLRRHSTFVPMENMCVYGTACKDFSFRDGQAINDIWGPKLETWLATFLKENPSPETQVTWTEMLCHIQSWGIKPFKSDNLGTLHLCNHLAARKMCIPATTVEIGQWISVHRNLGAYRGLLQLGFGPLTSVNDVVHAVQMMYDHLDCSLSSEQKEFFGFGTAFLENLLCKVSRTAKLHERLRLSETLLAWANAHYSTGHSHSVVVFDWGGRKTCTVYAP